MIPPFLFISFSLLATFLHSLKLNIFANLETTRFCKNPEPKFFFLIFSWICLNVSYFSAVCYFCQDQGFFVFLFFFIFDFLLLFFPPNHQFWSNYRIANRFFCFRLLFDFFLDLSKYILHVAKLEISANLETTRFAKLKNRKLFSCFFLI